MNLTEMHVLINTDQRTSIEPDLFAHTKTFSAVWDRMVWLTRNNVDYGNIDDNHVDDDDELIKCD